MKLWQLRIGERFQERSTGRIFVVCAQEGTMTEVRHKNKYWAWPNQANVVLV